MRIDAITIFPEYLEPLRHALLGKAIEDGHLSVHLHNLRDWATDNHKSVDDRPAGGGPGMVMKPEVWGPALDAVWAGREGHGLETSLPHTTVARHDDLGGVAAHRYGDEVLDERPVLVVPTPTGVPFSQRIAEELSREERIVFACGRYEGIDQRVFEDAEKRYRVKEISIGDYVLIGGEVAVLVIAEAVTRLIPGVLGNKDSHLQDSFSDGLLEGPSYTKPRVWRGLSVPSVLLGGDHQAIARYRRTQSLERTRRVRPELLETADLSPQDRFELNARDIRTTLNVMVNQSELESRIPKALKKLRRERYLAEGVYVEQMDLTCEPDNMLVTQYQQETGRAALDPVLRVLINARTDLELPEATQRVVRAFGNPTYWYGTSDEGFGNPEIRAACAWRRES